MALLKIKNATGALHKEQFKSKILLEMVPYI